MADIFISYSRKDKKFVRKLNDSFTNESYKIWVDVEDIPPVATWRNEIAEAIEKAHTFILVLSPDSVKSPYCNQEIEHALKHNKRLIPVVCKELDPDSVRQEVGSLNWIFLRESDDFNSRFMLLIEAIGTDLDWVKLHTRYLNKAGEWDKNERNRSFAMRGVDLKESEEFLARGPDKEPKPTSLQTEYIIASRKAQAKRQRITFSAITIGLVIIVVAGLVAYFQHLAKQRQQRIASARQLVSRSDLIRDQKVDGLEESLQLAVAAVKKLDSLGIRSLEADQALRKSMRLLPKDVQYKEFEFKYHGGGVKSVAFSSDGEIVAWAERRGNIQILNTESGEKIPPVKFELDSMSSINDIALSMDGKLIAVLIYDARSGNSSVILWDIIKRQEKMTIPLKGRDSGTELNLVGNYLALSSLSNSRIWDLASRMVFEPWKDKIIARSLALSPDGQYLAAVIRKHKSREVFLSVLDIASRKEVDRYRQASSVRRVFWAENGQKLVSVDRRSTRKDLNRIWVWDWQRDKRQLVPAGVYTINALAFSPDGKYIAVKNGSRIVKVLEFEKVLQLSTDNEFKRLIHPDDTELDIDNAFFVSKGGTLKTANVSKTKLRIQVWIWEFGLGSEFIRLRSKESASQLSFSPDGKYLCAGKSDSLQWWEVDSWKEVDGSNYEKVVSQPFNSRISLSRLQKGLTAADKSYFIAHGETVLAQSPDGKYLIAAGGEDLKPQNMHNIRILDSSTGRELVSLRHDDPVLNVAFSPNSRLFFTISGSSSQTRSGRWQGNNLLRVWRVSNWKESPKVIKDLEGKGVSEIVKSIDFIQDDRYIVLVKDNSLAVREMSTGRILQEIYHASLTHYALDAERKFLITSSQDRSMKIWEMSSGLEIARMSLDTELTSLAFSPDTRWLATAGTDHTVRLWRWQPQDMITEACSRLTTKLKTEGVDQSICSGS